MIEFIWISLNVLVGLPVVLAAIVILREGLRGVLALALGFRVFEIRLGVGRTIYAEPVGPVDFAIGTWPLGGGTIAASGVARRHRGARAALAAAPLLAQTAALLWCVGHPSAGLDTLAQGPAPLALLTLGNGFLLALHGLLPIEWAPEIQTDIRTFLDVSFGRADVHRNARATYYARTARHALERADVSGARDSLDRGLVQLGREALLVECEALLSTGELSSVIDQGEAADALLEILQRTAKEDAAPASQGVVQSVRRAAIYALPCLCALLALSIDQRSWITHSLAERWISSADSIAEAAVAADCAAHLERSTRWPNRLVENTHHTLRRDHLHQRARLEACRGDLDRALRLQREALAAADSVRSMHRERPDPDASGWLRDELRFVAHLRLGAELERRSGRYRLALEALGRADEELALIRLRMAQWTEVENAAAFAAQINAEARQTRSARGEVLTQLAAH